MSKINANIAAQPQTVPPKRNYELDFLKLFFAVMVFWCHTPDLEYSGEKITVPPMLGRAAVHFFFILSGMLMANSIAKRDYSGSDPAKEAGGFVLKKFKAISLNYIAAFLISVVIFVIVKAKDVVSVLKTLISAIPEMLFVHIEPKDTLNVATWYLAAMFLCMLPLAYLLYKKRGFALYIFAPVTAVTLYTLMYYTNKTAVYSPNKFYTVVTGGIIDTVFGLCCGMCAYNIYKYISTRPKSKSTRILLTVTEVLLYGVFFGTWFGLRTNKTTMTVLLLLPIAIAITFSGQSYIVRLFRFRWMKCFAPLSLLIYLSHYPCILLVNNFFGGKSYADSVILTSVFTAASCLLNWFIVYVIKLICKTKRR